MGDIVRLRPGSLWSLWDMLERHCSLFSEGFANLTEAKHLAALYGVNGNQPPEAAIRAMAGQASHQLRQAIIYTGMDGLLLSLDRLDMAISGSAPMPLMNLSQAIMHALSVIRDSLAGEHFFYMTQSDVPLYLNSEPFGSEVAKVFPEAAEDIEEAAKCLALQRSTACVFHLMRALEAIVRRLGLKLGVQNVDKDWGKILSDIGGAIEKMPKGQERDSWSGVHANLYHVKQAWRNTTMHPRQTYTREQAHQVFAATRVFAVHLSGLV